MPYWKKELNQIPVINIPPIEEIETISIPLPTAEVPFYTPLVIPPSDLRSTEQIEITTDTSIDNYEIDAEATEGTSTKPSNQPGMRTVNLFSTNVEIPLPENEILITATTTAVVSVGAALTATAVFNWVVKVMKPVIKTLWKKMTKGNGSTTR